MTRIDFYVVKTAGADARLNVAARLTEKALGRGHRIFINCESADQLSALDSYLWEFKATSFVPHEVAGNHTDERVVLGFEQGPQTHNDVLINLALSPPSYFAQFERVAGGRDTGRGVAGCVKKCLETLPGQRLPFAEA
jgi:DNA polymerase-3 subunit chi